MDMRRREFMTLLGGAAALRLTARAQQPKVTRIGFLRYASPHEKQFNAFRDGLRALGYIKGQNIVIEQRYVASAPQRLGLLAEELFHLNMDVIIMDGSATAKAVKAETSTIPVVFSLGRRPGGGATGYDIERKWREVRIYQTAPISTNMVLAYVAQHVLGLPRSY